MKYLLFLFSLCGVFLTNMTLAQESSEDSSAEKTVELPERGITMDAVRQLYGDAGLIMEAIGEPPITRWVYGAYTVYFEHDRVITAVLND